ncbi:hypothetical protein Btru_066364 [Bulinus truncatus]|nr:hypothetical protein Btru_066364 [Bulinus truncatus]
MTNLTSLYVETTEVTLTDAVIVILCFVFSFLICIVNIFTILVVWRTTLLRTYAFTYVVSLAVADFIVGLQFLPLALFFLPPTRVRLFNYNIHMCLLMNGLTVGMTSVSLLHMGIISIDRYFYIVRPYFYEKAVNSRLVTTLIVLSWTMGVFLLVLPQLIHKDVVSVPSCDLTLLVPVWHLFYGVWILYFSVTLLILLMYVLIFLAAVKQRRAVNVISTSIEPTAGSYNSQTFNRDRRRSFRFFLTLFGVFFMCLTPVVVVMGLDYYLDVPVILYRFFVVLAMSNSGMNFVIFALQNKVFRVSLLRMLKWENCIRDSEVLDTLSNNKIKKNLCSFIY